MDQQKGVLKKKSVEEVQEQQDQYSEIARRLRVLEERNSNLDKKLQLLEQNLLNSTRKLNSDMKSLTSEMTDLKKELQGMRDRMMMMIKEIQLAAKQEDVTVLKRYLEYWQPMQFATKKDVERIIEQIKPFQEN